MIAKGGARSGPEQCATYLMRVGRYDTGEEVELIEFRSPWGKDIAGKSRQEIAARMIEAFRDMQDLAEGTKNGRDGLYRSEINPAPKYAREMTREQIIRSADILEEELGFQGQDRVIVRHAGTDGRAHWHVVWQRVDLDKMMIIPDSFNYVAHERASKRMELEFGHEFVPGKHAKRDRERQPDFPRQDHHYAEAQMAQRSDMTPEERKEQMTAMRVAAANGQELKKALEDEGYVLAKGDRGYLVVDAAGVHSVLSRNIGLKKDETAAFMADVPLEALPTIEQAQAMQEAKVLSAQPPPAPPEEQRPPGEMTDAERKTQISALRQQSDNALAFKNALEEAGYLLAHGPRNGFYVIDRDAEVFNLSRLSGISGKEYKEFMAGIDPASVPDVESGKAIQQARAADARKQAPETSKFLPPDLAQKLEGPAPALADAQKESPEASKFLTPPPPHEKSPEVPAPKKPAQPPEDPELTALKKALEERHAKEVQKWAEYNALELRRLEYDLTKLNDEKAKDFAALQNVAMDALKDRLKEERTGLKGALNAIQSKLNPTLAAEKAKERRREIGQLKARQERELKDYLALIEQTKELEIENLKERQALQSIDRERKHEEEQETNVRDHHEAQRLLAELEAKRIHEELEKNDDLRDGPPPPRRGK